MALSTKKFGNLELSNNDAGSVGGVEGIYSVYLSDSKGNNYLYVPMNVIEKGVKVDGTNYYFPYFMDVNNLNKFAQQGEVVDINKLPSGSKMASMGIDGKGFLVPANVGFNGENAAVPKGWGDITGLSIKDGQIAYATTGRAGDQFGWITKDNVGSLPQPQRHGGLRGYLERAGSAIISAGPVIQLMAAITADPVLYGIAAGSQAGQGNLLGAAINMAGMAGAIPGIDASTAADLKATQSVLQISNALKNDNPIAALSALGGMSGAAVPPEVVRGAQLIAINDALQRGDMKSLAVAVGNISNTPEVAYAGKAAKVLEAIDSGNINKVAASLNTLLPELKSAYKSTDFKQAFANVGADLTEDQFAKLDQMLGTTGEQLINAALEGVADTQAQAEGWNNSQEQQEAQKLGFATPNEYETYRMSQMTPTTVDVPKASVEESNLPPEVAQQTQEEEKPAQETQVSGGLPTIGGPNYRTSAGRSSPTQTTSQTSTPGGLAAARRAATPDAQYWQFNPSIGLPDVAGATALPGTDPTQSILKPVDVTGQDQGTTPMAGTGQPGQTFNPGQVQELGQLFGSLTPEMKNALVQSGNVHPDIVQAAQNPYATDFSNLGGGMFAGGGTVGSTISNVQDALAYKPIAPMVEPMLKAAPVSDTGVTKMKALKHLKQSIAPSSPLSSSEGLARGGLPSKYHEAMPDGHKPEFVTGLTGYYAGGRGTGQSDDIDAMLHDGDYVMDAEAVSALGDGSSKAGKDSLTHFLGQVPHRDGADGKPVPAKIADGEFVLPESFVTALGGGDNKRGAKMLDEMRERLRSHKRSAPTSKIPPKAKSPLEYLEGVKG